MFSLPAVDVVVWRWAPRTDPNPVRINVWWDARAMGLTDYWAANKISGLVVFR